VNCRVAVAGPVESLVRPASIYTDKRTYLAESWMRTLLRGMPTCNVDLYGGDIETNAQSLLAHLFDTVPNQLTCQEIISIGESTSHEPVQAIHLPWGPGLAAPLVHDLTRVPWPFTPVTCAFYDDRDASETIDLRTALQALTTGDAIIVPNASAHSVAYKTAEHLGLADDHRPTCRIIPQGVDVCGLGRYEAAEARVVLGLPQHETIITTITASTNYNVGSMISLAYSCAQLRGRGIPIHLVIVAPFESPQVRGYLRLFGGLGLAGHVTLRGGALGPLDQMTVPMYYAATDIYIACLTTGFDATIAYAVATGRPAVISEMTTHGADRAPGLLRTAAVSDETRWASATNSFLSSRSARHSATAHWCVRSEHLVSVLEELLRSEVRTSLGAANREWALRELRWESITRQYTALWSELRASSPRRRSARVVFQGAFESARMPLSSSSTLHWVDGAPDISLVLALEPGLPKGLPMLLSRVAQCIVAHPGISVGEIGRRLRSSATTRAIWWLLTHAVVQLRESA
jgi:hypothetical protein